MALLPMLALVACARRPPADAGQAPEPPSPAPSQLAEAPAPPAWLSDVIPALQAQDWPAAEAALTRALEGELSPQERTLALWYRAAARASADDRAGELEDLRAFVSSSRLLHVAGDAPGAMLQ